MELLDHSLGTERFETFGLAGCSEAGAKFGVVCKHDDGVAQGVEIGVRDEAACDHVAADFAGAIDVVGDGACACEEGLWDGAWEAFA